MTGVPHPLQRHLIRLLASVACSLSLGSLGLGSGHAAQPSARAAATTAATPTQQPEAQAPLELEDLRALAQGQLPQATPLSALFETNLNDEQAVADRVAVLKHRLAAPLLPGETPDSRERDRLRLAFLELPAAQRHALQERDRLAREAEALAIERAAAQQAATEAEARRQAAIAEAQAAADAASRAKATAKARWLAQQGELNRLQQTWAAERATQVNDSKRLIDRYAAVDGRHILAPDTADALYRRLDEDLAILRTAARQSMDALDADSAVPDPSDATNTTDADLGALRDEVLALATTLRAREADQRYALAAERMATLSTLQARRVALLPQLSPAERARWTGLSLGAWQRVKNELAHVQLIARWYPVKRQHGLEDLVRQLQDRLTAGRYGLSVLVVLALLAGLMTVRARSRAWLDGLRRRLMAHMDTPALSRWLNGALRMLITIAPELVLLGTIYLLFDQVLRQVRGLPELETLRALAYAYAWYALGLAFAHRVLLTAVSRYRAVNPALNAKIRKSLQMVGAVVLGLAVYLLLAQAALGRGALYGIALKLATVAALLVAWRLIRHWRKEVTQTYLKFFPEGRLANAVRSTQERSLGILVAGAAFVFVAARGLWIWLRDVMLGFEQTRRALAYLMRRQLLRQSRKNGQPHASAPLPPKLEAALTEEAATEALSIEHYPELPTALADLQALADGGSGGLVALCGERGSGKTSWMMALERQAPAALQCTRHEFSQRLSTEAELCEQLCQALGLDQTGPMDRHQLCAALLAGPPRVVMLDLCQNLMLRTVGGLAAYEALLRLAEDSAPRVWWVLAFARWPFEYLQRLHPHRDVYDRVVSLRGWSEDAISELLCKRLEVAGYTANYDELLNQMSSVQVGAHGSVEQADRNSDRFHRLIWDYADGNPRVALHFFRLALAPDPLHATRVDVRLFPMPEAQALERFKQRTQFVLACLVQHENITPQEACDSLRFAHHEVRRSLELLHQEGFLVSNQGRYRVSSHWNPAVLRFLQRKKLLPI